MRRFSERFPLSRGRMRLEGNLLSRVMEVGDYRRPIDGFYAGSAGGWSECAEQASKQVHQFVVANREQIIARRSAP
jgi:hypothetical protein